MLKWILASCSVLVISVVGALVVLIVPFLQHDHQSNVSQLFVGLAMGTLTSDALLHLLPHAFFKKAHKHGKDTTTDTKHQNHSEHLHEKLHEEAKTEGHHSHDDYVWIGMMCLLGIIGFYVFERLVSILRDLSHEHAHEDDSTKSQRCASIAPNSALMPPELEKLNHKHEHEMKEKSAVEGNHAGALMNGGSEVQVHDECHRSTITFANPDGEGYMHLGAHHHHHHKAAKAPNAALMVLIGDIVHNLFDGMAIGVAFSGHEVWGGISTSIAVLCHELPHELGDFSIIIRNGMKVRHAFLWNLGASFICWVGMAIGLLIGNNAEQAWLYAFIGGTFLYISLVDMVPELDSCPHLPSKNQVIKLTVQTVGISVGVVIMLVISLYEEKLENILKAPV